MAKRVLHLFFFYRRGMTLGVRGACFDVEGRVFLVRHTYISGWHLPGGGVERHETGLQALHKEIREEGNLAATSTPKLFHVYFNNRTSDRDHVLLYRLDVRQTAAKVPDREISESGFFSLDALPEGTTPATRRRLTELGGEATPDDYW
ncbi:NUDIX domain-containing protein [Agrobacterium larrymoorei]|uniref:NUDIX domain-containing protein n=1 Tax=Agrobacterium larrymoorei TaxID=160699 RepID=UPI001571A40B|nr:NUDIX domain-containing protein [Agrobacterium larrymoorei]NTJ42988.1 NUDIX domain-containing protein [Agrobacterium larrymoorei]